MFSLTEPTFAWNVSKRDENMKPKTNNEKTSGKGDLWLAVNGAVAIVCEHGYDACPECDEMITPMCDFCTSTHPIWRYFCDDFVVTGILLDEHNKPLQLSRELIDSTMAWDACNMCAPYIEAKDMVFLARRNSEHDGLFRERLHLYNAFMHFRKDQPRQRL
jgi:hypothetical protein